MNRALRITLIICAVIVSIQLLITIIVLFRSFYKYFICSEVDFQARYGENTYVVVTGGSSGQGREFAIQFAQRGFHLLIIGSENSYRTKKYIEQRYPGIKCDVLIKDFCQSFETRFFDDIEQAIQERPVSVLVNNIGFFKLFRKFFLKNFLKKIFKSSVVSFKNCIFC